MTAWALDLGTTNTGVACWDPADDKPTLVELPEICRRPQAADPLEAPRKVPSAVRVMERRDFKDRLGARPFFTRHFFIGKQGLIGRPAVDMQEIRASPAYASGWKLFLEREARRPFARAGKQVFTVRDVARIFVRELLAEVKAVTGERIRDVVLTAPIEAYESYRAELAEIARHLGIKKLRFLDEPVAAALGYGLGISRPRTTLLFDFGGGTMHLALVRLTPKSAETGACDVIAKEGRTVGGTFVDRWLLREFCKRLDYSLHEDSEDDNTQFWVRAMLAEACRVKESVFFREAESFQLTPPEDLRALEARLRGAKTSLAITRADVVNVLRENGLYQVLQECLDSVMRQGQEHGIGMDEIDDVLMVGGSSLLPEIYSQFEQRFGRDRVRAWQPFEAVAYGGSVFAAGAMGQSDFIVHDYAFVTHDARTHEPQYTVIVPRGTRFPTPADFWKRQLVPTCSLGEPETMFKLSICEIGEGAKGERRRFGWDAAGNLHKMGGQEGHKGDGDRMVVPLNESNPTLGYLNPPHPPSDKRPRLEIAFQVNAERWLCATVMDLKTRRPLMKQEPVVRLL